MANVILRQKAIDDLNNIWDYTFEKWSESQANKYYETIKFACKEIGRNPDIGRIYTEISTQLFGLKSGNTSYSIIKLRKTKLKLLEFYIKEWN